MKLLQRIGNLHHAIWLWSAFGIATAVSACIVSAVKHQLPGYEVVAKGTYLAAEAWLAVAGGMAILMFGLFFVAIVLGLLAYAIAMAD